MRANYITLTAAVLLAGACAPPSDSIKNPDPQAPVIASVSITPPSILLQVGKTLQLQGAARDSAGNSIADRVAQWKAADTSIATISAAGVLAGRKAGSTTVTLTIGGKSANAPAAIALVPVAAVSVSPSGPAAQVGATVQFSATARDASGNALTGRSLAWSSSNPSVATVNSAGLASTVAAGTANIVAVCEGVSGQSTITVSNTAPPPPAAVATVTVSLGSSSLTAGQTTQATAVLKDANGNVLTGRTITWSSSSTAVATVAASGLVSAVSQGNATITATSETKSGGANLTVAPSSSPTKIDTIFAETFESGTLAVWDDGVDPTRHHVITNASLAHSGSRALEVDYPANDTGGWLTKFFMPGYDSVYVRMYVRFAPDWVGGSKLMLLRGSRTDNQWSAFGVAGECPQGSDFFATNIMMEGNGDPGTLRFYTYFPEMAREPDGVTCWGRYGDGNEQYLPLMSLPRDSWQQLGFWVRLNTPGQHDGYQKFWVNGTLRGVWTNLSYRTSNILKLNSFSIELSSPLASVARHLWIDDILVTTALPPSP
jgi:uncharacterized protein YjdB